MPIRKFAAQRKGLPPVMAFSGTLREVEEMCPSSLAFQLRQKSKLFLTNQEALAFARKILPKARVALGAIQNRRRRNFGWGTNEEIFSVNFFGGKVFFVLRFLPNGKILIRQQPVTHGIIRNRGRLFVHECKFAGLLAILQKGFLGCTNPNAVISAKRREMALANPEYLPGIVHGDRFSIEFMNPTPEDIIPRFRNAFVEKAAVTDIASVNIELDSEATAAEKQKKKAFYLRIIKKRFGVPVHFV
jgi:hypothetical protein